MSDFRKRVEQRLSVFEQEAAERDREKERRRRQDAEAAAARKAAREAATPAAIAEFRASLQQAVEILVKNGVAPTHFEFKGGYKRKWVFVVAPVLGEIMGWQIRVEEYHRPGSQSGETTPWYENGPEGFVLRKTILGTDGVIYRYEEEIGYYNNDRSLSRDPKRGPYSDEEIQPLLAWDHESQRFVDSKDVKDVEEWVVQAVSRSRGYRS